MEKQGKTILVGLLALCVLGGAYVGIGHNKRQRVTEVQAAEDAARDCLTDMGDVTYFSYENDGEMLEFEKEDGIWYYASDHSVSLIQNTLDSMTVGAKKTEITRTLGGVDGLEVYGLSEPVNRITIRDTDGNAQTVLLGNAAGDGIYACLDGQEAVTVIGSEPQSMTEKTLEGLMEMETEVESEVSKQEAPGEQEASSQM